MQKIKYIIIFTLVLALGMVLLQLTDYQKITSTLLQNNSEKKDKNIQLQNAIISLKAENEKLQNKIISLEETLALTKLQYNSNYSNDNNVTKEIFLDIKTLKNLENKDSSSSDLAPNITIENQRDITGFGLEYNQKF